MSYHTYIAECNDGSLYTGYCKDLQAREETHNAGKGARYTRGRTPVKMIYNEEFETISEAMKREIEIKKLTRDQKKELINKNNK